MAVGVTLDGIKLSLLVSSPSQDSPASVFLCLTASFDACFFVFRLSFLFLWHRASGM